MNWNKLDTEYNERHSIFLSRKPDNLDEFLKFLERESIQTVCVLQQEHELKKDGRADLLVKYEENGQRVLHFSVKDDDVPSSMDAFNQLVQKIDSALKEAPLLIHCAGGRGRTGVAAAGWLIWKGMNTEEAVMTVRKAREGALAAEIQVSFLDSYRQWLEQQ